MKTTYNFQTNELVLESHSDMSITCYPILISNNPDIATFDYGQITIVVHFKESGFDVSNFNDTSDALDYHLSLIKKEIGRN